MKFIKEIIIPTLLLLIGVAAITWAQIILDIALNP